MTVENHNWLVTDNGQSHPFGTVDLEEPERPYRLYRFLADLDDILDTLTDDVERIQAIAPLVRKLLISSYWLQLDYNEPSSQTGWSVKFLYREQGYPLTVQMVTWRPGTPSPIHNHGTWGIVAIVGGQEKNQLWRRVATAQATDKIEPTETITLIPGDLIGFTSGAIHHVESLGDDLTISFNLYGVTDYQNRYQFDPVQQTAKRF